MFAGYPYSREQLEKLNEEIEKNATMRRADRPLFFVVCGMICRMICSLCVCGYALAGLIFLIYLIFFCP